MFDVFVRGDDGCIALLSEDIPEEEAQKEAQEYSATHSTFAQAESDEALYVFKNGELLA